MFNGTTVLTIISKIRKKSAQNMLNSSK